MSFVNYACSVTYINTMICFGRDSTFFSPFCRVTKATIMAKGHFRSKHMKNSDDVNVVFQVLISPIISIFSHLVDISLFN